MISQPSPDLLPNSPPVGEASALPVEAPAQGAHPPELQALFADHLRHFQRLSLPDQEQDLPPALALAPLLLSIEYDPPAKAGDQILPPGGNPLPLPGVPQFKMGDAPSPELPGAEIQSPDQQPSLELEAYLTEDTAVLTAQKAIPEVRTTLPAVDIVSLSDAGARIDAATKLSDIANVVQAAPIQGAEQGSPGVRVFSAEQVIDVPLGQPRWDQALGNRVLWLVNQETHHAELRLNPPELGPLEVRISIDGERANINFTANHWAVREALESAIPRLREMFAESGLNLVDVNVSQHSFAEQQHSSPHPNQTTSHSFGEGMDEEPGFEASDNQIGRQGAGVVDYYA